MNDANIIQITDMNSGKEYFSLGKEEYHIYYLFTKTTNKKQVHTFVLSSFLFFPYSSLFLLFFTSWNLHFLLIPRLSTRTTSSLWLSLLVSLSFCLFSLVDFPKLSSFLIGYLYISLSPCWLTSLLESS